MSVHTSVTSSGLVSLSGFAYQMKVFLLLLSKTIEGQQVEFETLDDVVVSDIIDSNKEEDRCLKRIKTSDGHITAVQVKQTNVTPAISRKILHNWLLAYAAEPSITSFSLYTEKNRTVSQAAFCGEAETEFKAIIESSELPTALISRVKNLYGKDFDRFKDDYHFIINHISTTQEDVDPALSDVLKREFHATAGTVGPVFFECRIKELFHRICSRIIDCSLKREPYICTNGEFEQLCEEICKCISAEHFEPDYQAFSKNIKPLVLSEPLMSCREYRQLEYCELPIEQIFNHIRWEQYYENIRQHYLLDAQGDKITSIEDVAFYNHQGIVIELQTMKMDIPKLRLVKTKMLPISTLTNEFSRWGAYIYLTKDDTPNQISWKEDDEDEAQQC